jgi:phospholipid-translocating ATPase
MPGYDDHSDSESHVRRRHSAHHDRDDIDLGHAHHDTLPNERLQSSHSATGTDVPTHTARESTERPSRVSFASQERGTSSHGKKRKSDEDTRPNLSVDINAAAAHSPVASLSGVPSSSSNSRLNISPMSPQSRARGYSLRSSLFQRNMHDRSTNPPISASSIIELDPIGPSSHSPTRPQSSKKSMDAVVEVAQLHDEERDLEEQDPKLASFNRRQGVQGIGALPHYQSWIQQHTARNHTWRSLKDGYHKARKFVLRIQDIPPTKDGRHIDLDASRKVTLLDERTGKAYITNYIRSSRYTAWNFVPRQLFAQFSKLANFYFLCVSILQMIPGLSTTGSK